MIKSKLRNTRKIYYKFRNPPRFSKTQKVDTSSHAKLWKNIVCQIKVTVENLNLISSHIC